MIKIDLITGFLGAGKTTFIETYARWLMARGEKIGILENDYGAVNVDRLLLQGLEGPRRLPPAAVPDQADRHGDAGLRPGDRRAVGHLRRG